MKIIHVSNFSSRKQGRNFYSIEHKLSNGFIRLGHFVYEFSDRDEASRNMFRVRELGVRRANRHLLEACRNVKPDLVVLGHCSLITPDTIEAVRREGGGEIRIAHWNCDALFTPKNLERLKALAPLVDITCVTTAGDYLGQVVERGGRASYMPNPVDSAVENIRAFERTEKTDLVFLSGRDDVYRRKVCEAIRQGAEGLKFEVRGLFGAPSLYGAGYFDFLALANMGLNLSARDDVYLYSSDRMVQLMGCGLLTFLDRRTGFGDIFGPDEIALFENIDDLVDKVRFFASHDAERKKVARSGWARIHRIFNERLVAQWIVDLAFERPASHAYEWPLDIVSGPKTALTRAVEGSRMAD